MLYGEFNFCPISLKQLLFDLKLGNDDNDDDDGGGGVCVCGGRGALVAIANRIITTTE